ncbi:MAG: TolC family protein [Gammaproteobacteria bacterium]|nr:TolC family protein [Gammaproteobacteria bacterium]
MIKKTKNKGAQGLIGALCLFALPVVGVCAELFNYEQALAITLQRDPRILEKTHLTDVARAQEREVDGNEGLRLDFNSFLGLAPGVSGGLFTAPCSGTATCINRTDRYSLAQGISPWTYAQISVIKPLFTFGKIEHYREAAQGQTAVKMGDVRLQRGEIALEVAKAYYGHLAARDARAFLEEVRKTVASALEKVNRWLKDGSGEATQSDAYALQTGLALVDKFLAQTRGLEAVSLEGLRTLTGISEFVLADTRLQRVTLPSADIAALQARAIDKRPEFAQLEAGVKARRALVAANRAGHYPNVYVGIAAMLSYSPNRDRLDNPYITDSFNDYGGTPLIGLQWQWQPGVVSAKVAQAEGELNALIDKAALARQGIPFQVAEAYYQMRAAYEGSAKSEEGARAARRWMITAYADFDAGLEKPEKVLTALQGYVLAQTDYIQGAFEYNMAVVKLRQTVGDYE